MAAVRQQVLNWLYSVLTSEYTDVTRTYNDVAQALSHYSSLSPRTDVYTYENGVSALLLHISGTLPVLFRGTTYRFPIALWVPHAYPSEAPLVYVTPTEGMMVRPGQHVDPQGKIYHPYLAGFAEFDRSNIMDFLAILRDIFGREPPVISRQQQNAPRPQPAVIPPPVPPLPPGVGVARTSSPIPSHTERPQSQPPPPPPKPINNPHTYSPSGPSRDSGPPLPPLPPQQGYDSGRYGLPAQQQPNEPHYAPQRSSTLPYENSQRSSSLRYETAPPLPPQPQGQPTLQEASYSPVSPITPPLDPFRRPSHAQTFPLPQSQPNPQPQPQPKSILKPQTFNTHQNQQPMPPSYTRQQPYQGQLPNPQWQQQYQPQFTPQQQQPQQKPPPPPDLLDAPLVLSIPSHASTNLPAPPIPPNPEKDMLLHNLSRSLYSQRQHTRNQTSSSLPGLAAQHEAMLSALNTMQSEISSLEALNSLLTTNTNILHTALHDADAMIESSQHRTAPNVDELLVAPTVVANQLYELVSEERSLGDTLFVLGRAVERGRIEASVFAKMTRSLAREWYLKKALAKKIGRGMGLATY
ncbi:UEV-domain-containing protein [Hyaloscypha bicolor E]|uniref:UEV-domain-containing protein n=1 Tax=Hyaloscypha bicolor E TaxID=1095630 RepID=A0A2J6TT29_9HELO|nr:UEV-domain-containing protein [Hyaloscypha bicolor E]PMD66167.1 UEV-domain-containing protein [Hyaloscypha bicolor E]